MPKRASRKGARSLDATDATTTRVHRFSRGGNSTENEPRLYDRVGGEGGLRALVKCFYDIIKSEPEGRALHVLRLRGHGVAHSRIEQFKFLSGFLGGPSLYVQKHGHSNVRTMHEHVEINAEVRDAWLNCMSIAIDRVALPLNTKQELMRHFTRVAMMLKNRD